MTSILKKQLSFLCAAGVLSSALAWNIDALRAQGAFKTDGPKVPTNEKLSRDAAARAFVSFLNTPNDTYSDLSDWAKSSIVAPKTRRELNNLGQLEEFLNELRSEWKRTNHTLKVLRSEENMAIVTLENNTSFPVRPLVLIKENGSWGVDILETYAKWNILKKTSREEAIDRLSARSGAATYQKINRASCQSNLKRIGLGLMQYAQDYDEKLPLAKPWIDVLQPYIESEQIFNCPSLPKGGHYGYAYNSKLSNKNVQLLPNTAETVSIYETSILKRNAYGMGENRAFRHLDGANYAFVDGHVKWFGKSATPSFNIGKTFRGPILAPPGAPFGSPPAP